MSACEGWASLNPTKGPVGLPVTAHKQGAPVRVLLRRWNAYGDWLPISLLSDHSECCLGPSCIKKLNLSFTRLGQPPWPS